MKFTLYTTTNSVWYRNEAEAVAKDLSSTFPIEIELIKIKAPKNPLILKDKDGDIRFVWDWFTQTFPLLEDGVGFHFTPNYKKKWGIKLGGARNPLNKTYPEFWFTAGKEKAGGYDMSNFRRLLYHELGHFFEDLDDAFGDKLTQESVHHYDYDLKQIHLYHNQVDFKGFAFKRKVVKVIRDVLQLAHKII